MTCLNTLYHLAAPSLPSLPDIIVCANPDLAGRNDDTENSENWSPTLAYITRAGIPTVFTSLSEKSMSDDFSILRAITGVDSTASKDIFPVLPCQNPFKGLLPLPDIEVTDGFSYYNGFYCIMKCAKIESIEGLM